MAPRVGMPIRPRLEVRSRKRWLCLGRFEKVGLAGLGPEQGLCGDSIP